MDTARAVLLLIADKALGLYIVVIIIRALVSWFNPRPRHPIIRFLYAVTDPVLVPVRDLVHYRLRLNLGGLDLSPLLVILALYAVRGVLLPWLARL